MSYAEKVFFIIAASLTILFFYSILEACVLWWACKKIVKWHKQFLSVRERAALLQATENKERWLERMRRDWYDPGVNTTDAN